MRHRSHRNRHSMARLMKRSKSREAHFSVVRKRPGTNQMDLAVQNLLLSTFFLANGHVIVKPLVLKIGSKRDPLSLSLSLSV